MTKTVFTYPAGKLIAKKDTAIAGNVATDHAVPTGKRWYLLTVFLKLTTDATVANRKVRALHELVSGSTFIQGIVESNTVTASSGNQVQARPTAAETGSGGMVYDSISFGNPYLLEAGEQIAISVTNGVAGDSYDYYVRVLEIDIE